MEIQDGIRIIVKGMKLLNKEKINFIENENIIEIVIDKEEKDNYLVVYLISEIMVFNKI